MGGYPDVARAKTTLMMVITRSQVEVSLALRGFLGMEHECLGSATSGRMAKRLGARAGEGSERERRDGRGKGRNGNEGGKKRADGIGERAPHVGVETRKQFEYAALGGSETVEGLLTRGINYVRGFTCESGPRGGATAGLTHWQRSHKTWNMARKTWRPQRTQSGTTEPDSAAEGRWGAGTASAG